ncbi:putative ABC transporter permease [Clostridium lundense]|uniref:putative ABC transporter permease n=1 Tax=Clostridium lundense TaxID=319475 RepID=UPI000488E6DD|nr:putative ABC transporter permease [Clostridium lundense]
MQHWSIFHFSFYYLFYCFCIYSFLGWTLETIYATVKKGHFVNRGFLKGTFCPIYGFGALSLIVFLYPVYNNLILLFMCSVILTTLIEYFTGYILEKCFNSVWWDYSDVPFNLKGRICLSFSLFWGIISIFIIKIIHPIVAKLISIIPLNAGIPLLYCLTFYFITDFATTIIEIVQIKYILKELDILSKQIKDKVAYIKENAAEKTLQRTENIEEKIEDLKSKYEALTNRIMNEYSRLIKAFPNITSKKFNHILNEIKEKISFKKN